MAGDKLFAPLYIKTDNSLLSSLIKIDDLIAYAKDNNLTALAITDDNLFGVYEFYTKCLKNNIKPIIGCEITIEEQKIALYAKNYQGYLELIQLNMLKEVNFDDLTNCQNLICVVPFSANHLYDHLNKIFVDIYQGVGDLDEKKQLTGNNIVFFRPCLYLKKDDKKYLRYIIAIKKGITCDQTPIIKENYHLAFSEEIKDIDLENNQKIVESCQVEIKKPKRTIPQFSEDSYEVLKNACREGLRLRIGDMVPKKYIERLKKELKIIKEMDYCDYFLIVQDFVLYAKKQNIIVGPGRGSAAGSLVAYCLAITEIDPLKYDLLFERFLNPARVSMPDIDIDFEDYRREEVINYCIEKYGSKKVAPIITFGTFGAKQAIRDVGRVLGIELKKIDGLCKMLDVNLSLKQNLNSEVNEYIVKNNLKDVYKIATKLAGLKRHTSLHAAGIVMSDLELDQFIPLVWREEKYISAFPMEDLADLGLLKMDFLGLKNLTIIANIIKEIPDFDLNDIPFNDQKTLSLFQTGDTLGVFQFESPGMINFLRELKPASFADVYAAIALFRPGPMKNIPLFIKRKQGSEKITYYHPDLEPILKDAYGVIIYQEQIMQIAHKMGGYDLKEADILRKAMSKKQIKTMQAEEEKFVKRALAKGYDEQLVKKIFALIAKFAEYGFNKAHSVAYAQIAYQMAYLKAHYPTIFYPTVLNNVVGSQVKTKEYLLECQKRNLKLVAPHVNKSKLEYFGQDKEIFLPLSLIKKVNKQLLLEIKEKAPFKDIFDFMQKVNIFDEESFLSLVYAGALDDLGFNRQTLVKNQEKLLNYSELIIAANDDNLKPAIEHEPEFLRKDLLQKEYQYLGLYLTEHPVTKYKLKDNNHLDLKDIEQYFDQKVNLIGLIDKVNEIKTKQNDKMAFLTISDEFSQIEAVVFPQVYRQNQVISNQVFKFVGRVEKRHGKMQLNIEKIIKI